MSAIRQWLIKLFITTLNSFQQDVHFNLQPPLYLVFGRLGQAPKWRSEPRGGDTHRPGRLLLGSPGMHLPPFHSPQPPSTLFASTGRWGDYDVSPMFQTLVMVNKGLAGTGARMA